MRKCPIDGHDCADTFCATGPCQGYEVEVEAITVTRARFVPRGGAKVASASIVFAGHAREPCSICGGAGDHVCATLAEIEG